MPSSTVTFNPCDVSKAKARPSGTIASAFKSFTGDAQAFDESLVQIKKDLVKDPEALKASWLRLKTALAEGIAEIKSKNYNAVPSVDHSQLANMDEQTRAEIKKRGCVTIRNVLPRAEAEQLKYDLQDYIKANPQTKGFPADNKAVYELYWSKSQVKARAHPNLRQCTQFMNKLWHAAPDAKVSLDNNVMYADRARIRPPGDSQFALGPHADGGSIERWEEPEYSRCYDAIFAGRWEEYDAYDATHRVNVDMTKYDSVGNCNIFRSFQGWLAVSEVAPKEGTILFAPLIKEVTAYWILRPFFDENDNIVYDKEFPGAFPGKSQEFFEDLHPGLQLQDLMVPAPPVNPGDMVFWHCDGIHAVDPVHEGTHDSSVFYIPSAPLCEVNLKYAWLQREAFLGGLAGPDFPGFPTEEAERNHVGRATPADVEAIGGNDALEEFVLRPLTHKSDQPGARGMVDEANKLLFK